MSEFSSLVDKLKGKGALEPEKLARYILKKKAEDDSVDFGKMARELGRKDAKDYIRFTKEISQ